MNRHYKHDRPYNTDNDFKRRHPSPLAPPRMPKTIVSVALPVPVHKNFDYIAPCEVAPGTLAQVPFQNRTLIGVVTATLKRASVASAKLKRVQVVLDERLPADILSLCRWTADYYHHPYGEVLHQALPPALRKRRAAPKPKLRYRLNAEGRRADARQLRNAPAQAKLLKWLGDRQWVDAGAMREAGFAADTQKRLLKRGWLQSRAFEESPDVRPTPEAAAEAAPQLNAGQRKALRRLLASLDEGFQPFVLHGITGSGKTEVYLRCAAQNLRRGRQTLVLTPEILLTPQLVEYFGRRLRAQPAVLHSGMPEAERLRAWRAAASGAAQVVIGTRLAVFAPLPKLGLIVVDEEHDPSFKQQDGINYSARDLAVVRAQTHGIPIALGSATPSLESLRNVEAERYELLKLPERVGGGRLPTQELIDIRNLELRGGLSSTLLEALERTLRRGEQALLFLNRRGFSPTWLCHRCGWLAECPNCDAKLVFHRQPIMLRCHHCDYRATPAAQCPRCQRRDMQAGGVGTQRIESTLRELSAPAPIYRIDRDAITDNDKFNALRDRINGDGAAILLGTQMLAKGHHFPSVTLVAIVDADSGLFSPDFRADERLGQQLLQVSGRGGRGRRPGRVLVQTRHPDHPLFDALRDGDYIDFARVLLRQRRHRRLPPYRRLVTLRARSKNGVAAENWLDNFKRRCPTLDVVGPLPAALSKHQGWHRRQLLCYLRGKADKRDLIAQLRQHASAARRDLHWSLDVDPQEP